MTGPEVVRAIDDALSDSSLHVIVIANEGLIVEALDGSQFLIEVKENK